MQESIPLFMQGSDHLVFSAIRTGDISSFEMLFKTHYSPLCRFAQSYLQDSEDAEEIVQSTFIGFWEKRESIAIDTSLKAYLYRSVRNACLNELKRQKVRKLHADEIVKDGEPQSEASDQIAMKQELEVKIQEAISKLPEQCQLIFRMSRFEELKYQEIADQLGLSIKTVENQMGKALRIMREQLKEYLPLIIVLMRGFLDL
ncbi:RNA polymerase sigma-70 factor (ECF subfamily) [Algoriphagus boseongensis]|uniref:RNA polymerase sigma-70 factor (ECF subfamily) n=1 Tax=Algoriphagus boseongensis TaxID=1442587 RepID=A0A4R6T6P0_9BACT|nr:RNA polymerase sigma-70 factor [Algoriphagus boseongensis]TDQ18271.1 RNA polymerase sigma-70 factor (ECF subfamily) [Algoriphagus boseongensis]